MGRKHSSDHHDKSTDGRSSCEGKKRERSPEEEQNPEVASYLNLEDLGAGYDAEEKHVARAIKSYNEKLLPFIQEHPSIFQRSGFLKIRGYASRIKSEYETGKEASSRSHRASPVMYDNSSQEDRLDRHRSKRPRHST